MLCKAVNCDRSARTAGLCQKHYLIYWRHGDYNYSTKQRQANPPELCTMADCNRPHQARGYCSLHYDRLKAHGDPAILKIRKTPAKFEIVDEHTAKIPLTRGFYTIVDLTDAEKLTNYIWYASGNSPYIRAQAKIEGKPIFMHRFLFPVPNELHIDHIDGNPLNNHKMNLRAVTVTDNMRNTDRHKNRIGVCYNTRSNSWMAYLDEPDKKRKYLGYRKSKAEALALVEEARCHL